MVRRFAEVLQYAMCTFGGGAWALKIPNHTACEIDKYSAIGPFFGPHTHGSRLLGRSPYSLCLPGPILCRSRAPKLTLKPNQKNEIRMWCSG